MRTNCHDHYARLMRLIPMLLLLAVLLSGCKSDPYAHSTPDPEKYASYQCYDPHLFCLDAYKLTDSTLVENELGLTFKITYRYAVGESDEEFICANVTLNYFMAFPDVRILQNPQRYVDVWNDWTIKEIKIYVQDLHDDDFVSLYKETEPARTPTKVLASATDADCFADMKAFATDGAAEGYICPDDYYNEMHVDDGRYRFFIRVSFNESKNIVWDSEISSYCSEATGERIICIDNGTMSNLFESDSKNVNISQFDKLNSFVADAIVGFFGKNGK